MTDKERAAMAEMLLCYLVLLESAASLGLDMRDAAAGIIGEVCDILGMQARPEWAAPSGASDHLDSPRH